MREKRKAVAISALAVAAAVLSLARISPSAIADAPARKPPRHERVAEPAEVGEGARALRDGAPIDLNRANAAELALLPGIGPTLAERIVEHRGSRGRFRTAQDLMAVRGVGPRTMERLTPLVAVPP